MSTTRKIMLLGLITVITGLPQLALSQQTLTLKDALNYALEHNAKVKKSLLDIDNGRYKTQEVRAQALPQINGSTGLAYNAIIGQQVVDFGGVTQKLKFGQTWNSNASIQLSQQLFNQQVFTGLQAARSSEEYYQLSANLTQEQIIEQVANAYYQVLVNRQQLNVIDTNIKNVKIVEKIINNQYKNGLARKIDVDRINVNLTNLNTQRTTVANGVTLLENQLKFAIGMPIENFVNLPSTELTEVRSLPILTDTVSLSNRIEMRLLGVQKNLLKLQRKAFAAEYYPSLMLTANYAYNSQANKFDYLNSNARALAFDVSAIGLTLKIPIFNGFLTRSKVRQAENQLKQFDADYLEISNGLNLAYENAKIQLKNSLNTINAQKKNAALANEIYLSTQNNYNNGLASLTDLLDTENALTQAQNSYTQALLNYKIAEIQLIKSQGNIKSLIK